MMSWGNQTHQWLWQIDRFKLTLMQSNKNQQDGWQRNYITITFSHGIGSKLWRHPVGGSQTARLPVRPTHGEDTLLPPTERGRTQKKTRLILDLFGDQDPHGPNVALFVGSLPPNLNEKQYETILLDYLDDSESAPSSSLEHSCPLVGRLSILILKYYSFHCQNFHRAPRFLF